MASRGLRNKSTRLSSPATLPTKEPVSVPEPAARAKESRKTLLDTWIEPPLRQAAPSFEDHKGLERVGVLEMMEPLGRPPTQKLLQKLKLSAPKPSPKATPGNGDEVTTPTTEVEGTDTTSPARPSRRSESTRADERDMNQISDSAKPGQEDEEYKPAGPVPPSPARQTVSQPSGSVRRSPSSNTSRTNIPTEHITIHVEAAIDEANRKNSSELIPGLRKICEDANADPALWSVLDAVLQKSPSRKQFRTFRRYIKSGLAQHATSPPLSAGPPSRFPRSDDRITSTPTRSFPSQNFPNSASRSPSNLRSPAAAPLPFHLQRPQPHMASPSMSPTVAEPAANANGTFAGSARHLPSEGIEDPGVRPARSRSASSSSSLSSAKSLDAETFAPTIEVDGEPQLNGSRAAKSAGQRQATNRVAAAGHNNTKTRTALSSIPKGTYADFASVNKSTTNRFKKIKPDPETDQEEIQRQKDELLKQSIHDYDRQSRNESYDRSLVAPRDHESSISSISAPPPPVTHPHHVHPACAVPSSPVGPEAPSEHLLRNGTSRKRSRNEHEDDEEAVGTPASSSPPPPPLVPPPPGAAASSRASTPRFAKLPPAKKMKKSARVMHSPNKPKNGGITAGIARTGTGKDSATGNGVDDSEEENNEYCGACGGPGELLCCDGCPNAFHGDCLEPPMDTNNPPDDQWFCPRCIARRSYGRVETSGVLGRIIRRVDEINPKAFNLPFDIREYFEGVKTGDGGEYEEVCLPRTQNNPVKMNRAGFIEEPNYKELRDSKNNLIVCYRCNLTSNGREIIPCDYCPTRWHLDCLNPPLAIPPRRRKDNPSSTWRCPLHIENELATRDRQELAAPGELGRMPRLRRPKNAIPYGIGLTRGYKNNGLIEIELMKDEEPDIVEVDRMGTVVRLPERGIRLDFIDRVKRSWYEDQTFPMHLKTRRRIHTDHYHPSVDLERHRQRPGKVYPSEDMEIDTEVADFFPSPPAQPSADQLTNYNLRAKSFAEQEAVLSLRRLSHMDNPDSNITGNAIEELTNALITDAPPLVAQAIQRDELAALTHLQSLIKKRISVVLRGGSAPELNGRSTLEALTEMGDSVDGIS